MRHNSSVFLTVAITMERHHAYCRPTQVGSKEAKDSVLPIKVPNLGLQIWNSKIWGPWGLLSVALKIKGRQWMIYILCSTTWRETRGAWPRDLPFMFALLFSPPWFWTFQGTFSYFFLIEFDNILIPITPFMFALLFSPPWFWTFPGTFSYFDIQYLKFNTDIFLFLLS